LIDVNILKNYYQIALSEISKIETYGEITWVILVYLLSYLIALKLKNTIPLLRGTSKKTQWNKLGDVLGRLLLPLLVIFFLRLSLEVSHFLIEKGWVLSISISVAVLILFHNFISVAVSQPIMASYLRWVGMPILFLHFAGLLDVIIGVLENIAIQVGNINISAYSIVRALIFGSLLFWLGRVSNTTSKRIILSQSSLDTRTKELFSKLFEVVIFLVMFILLLQVLGINLTALAVFGGALGVGLGFGLQAIASNFISGIIILLDRSVSIGDYVELEDGRCGLVRELNLRSTTLETYEGKDIVVPNEKFITSSFTNWTHKDIEQRYRVDFSVAYKTDIHLVVNKIKEAVAAHPQVLSGEKLPVEKQPDCEIDSFGDSGVNMFVEFWMEGIDDGRNRVGGDLLLIILDTLRENDVEIPFPQREVKILKY
jgi:small-conductance mechanosensitive channel